MHLAQKKLRAPKSAKILEEQFVFLCFLCLKDRFADQSKTARDIVHVNPNRD